MQHSNQSKSFSEICIGDKAEFEVKITEESHNLFSVISGDFSPIHCDSHFSSQTKFGKKIGYAFMLTGFLSRLYGEYLPGGSSICIKQESQFIKPFFIGDTIRITAEVVNKIDSTRFVEIKSEAYRDNGERIFKGLGVVQVMFERRDLQPLYESNNKNIYYTDIVNSLKQVGVCRGDVVFVHSDISVFGKLCTLDREFLLQAITNAIKDCVGEDGTIIMPTFTYSFCKGELYNVQATKSTVGILTEHFRNQPDVVRTVHPIFSVAIWGKNKNDFLSISKDSFDHDSIFGKLHKAKAKLIFFGAPFHSVTYIHYVEQAHGIPYRYMKSFKGRIKNGDNEYEDKYTFFVRDLDKNVILDTDPLEKYLIENKQMNECLLGNGRILSVGADVLFNEGCSLLDKNIYFFLKEEPK